MKTFSSDAAKKKPFNTAEAFFNKVDIQASAKSLRHSHQHGGRQKA